MCQAIPRKALQVGKGRAEVLIDGQPVWVSTIAVPDLSPGEYVVVYAGAAIERIPEADALELLSFLEAMGTLFGADEPALERSG